MTGEGHFTRSKERTRFFQNKTTFTDFGWIPLENKRIFARNIRDFLGLKMPLDDWYYNELLKTIHQSLKIPLSLAKFISFSSEVLTNSLQSTDLMGKVLFAPNSSQNSQVLEKNIF